MSIGPTCRSRRAADANQPGRSRRDVIIVPTGAIRWSTTITGGRHRIAPGIAASLGSATAAGRSPSGSTGKLGSPASGLAGDPVPGRVGGPGLRSLAGAAGTRLAGKAEGARAGRCGCRGSPPRAGPSRSMPGPRQDRGLPSCRPDGPGPACLRQDRRLSGRAIGGERRRGRAERADRGRQRRDAAGLDRPGGGFGRTGSGLAGPLTGWVVHRAVVRDRQLAVGVLLVAGLDVRLPRLRAFGHGDVVVGQQRPLGLLERDDRDVVGGLELGLLGHGLGVLADGVEVAVDRDPAFLVERPLGLEPLGGRGPQPGGGLELLVVGVDFQEEPGQRVGRLVDDLLEEGPLPEQGVLAPAGRWPAGPACPAASGR